MKAWTWMKKWGLAIAGGLLAVLGAGWLWRRQREKLGRVKDELAVARAKSKIDELRAVRREVESRLGETDKSIEVIDRQINEQRQVIVEAHENGANLSAEDVAEEMRRLGY